MNSRKSAILVAILFFLIGIAAVSIKHEKTVNLKENITAEIINEENRKLIGTEVSGGTPTILPSIEDSKGKNEIADTTSIQKEFSFCDDVIKPDSVTKFPTAGGKTPEVIFINGASIIFTKEGGEGWECKPGDTLSFSFEKYPSNVVDDQALIIGYIHNKTFKSGETFTELSGSYYTEIQEGGECFIYVISATSDYLALKEGEITVSYTNGELYPEAYITRDQAVMIINRAFGRTAMQDVEYRISYADLPRNHWAYDAVMVASTTM